jgi:hypothetical protein
LEHGNLHRLLQHRRARPSEPSPIFRTKHLFVLTVTTNAGRYGSLSGC